MTDKQPEALRLADAVCDYTRWGCETPEAATLRRQKTHKEAAAELRRLHEEVQQWQEKCNTYVELHDAVVKDSDRLYALNAELVEALKEVQRDVHRIIKGHFVHLPTVDEELSEAIAKAEGR